MANPFRGEKTFDADGKTWTLCFPSKSIRAFEAAVGFGINHLPVKLQDPSTLTYNLMVTLVWAGLLHNHKEITKDRADELIDEIGFDVGSELAMAALSGALDKGPSRDAPPTTAQVSG